MLDPGSLGQEGAAVSAAASAPGWFGGAIDFAVTCLAEQFDLAALWVSVDVWATEPGDVGWVLREVRPADWDIPDPHRK